MKPLIPLHDPRFKYTPSSNTDIRKTFERIRAEMAKQVVTPMRKAK